MRCVLVSTENVKFPGFMDKLRHVVDLELLVKPLAVPHHGGRLQAHRIGNLVGGLSGGDQSQDGDFLIRQGDWGSGFVVFHKAHVLKPLQKYTKKNRKTPHVYVELPLNLQEIAAIPSIKALANCVDGVDKIRGIIFFHWPVVHREDSLSLCNRTANPLIYGQNGDIFRL